MKTYTYNEAMDALENGKSIRIYGSKEILTKSFGQILNEEGFAYNNYLQIFCRNSQFEIL